MKRIFAVLLAVLTLTAVMAGCGSSAPALKMGLGVDAYYDTVSSATEEANGKISTVVTVAAVLLDAEGKIVKCDLDTLDVAVAFTTAGEASVANEFKTKYEQGKDYNMVAYGGAAKEWFEQADAFCAVVEGKTVAEVKALLAADGYKGNDEVITAGCTIGVADFVRAVEKACNNAEDSAATANDALNVGIVATASPKNASDEGNGSVKLEVAVAGAAVNAEGKVTAMVNDGVDSTAEFTAAGEAVTDKAKALSTKLELGDNYGMVAYGGAAKEWYDQAAAFDAICVGKTSSEIAGLVVDGYKGTEEVISAGCTIGIANMAGACAKAAK